MAKIKLKSNKVEDISILRMALQHIRGNYPTYELVCKSAGSNKKYLIYDTKINGVTHTLILHGKNNASNTMNMYLENRSSIAIAIQKKAKGYIESVKYICTNPIALTRVIDKSIIIPSAAVLPEGVKTLSSMTTSLLLEMYDEDEIDTTSTKKPIKGKKPKKKEILNQVAKVVPSNYQSSFECNID